MITQEGTIRVNLGGIAGNFLSHSFYCGAVFIKLKIEN